MLLCDKKLEDGAHLYFICINALCIIDRRTIKTAFLPNNTMRAVLEIFVHVFRDLIAAWNRDAGAGDAHNAFGQPHGPGSTENT